MSEAEQRFAALKQDSRIATFDQELRNLETRKTKVLEQGMPQESKRATIEAIDRNMDQVKQQLGAELKAMEPRIQAAAQSLEKVAQDLKMQPPKLNLEGMKPEGARAASEFVKASSVAQQAFQSAMAAGGGNKELQKAVAAVKAAIEAAQAISNPVSLAKTAAHVAKHVISMER